ncbi:MAG: hypothetical protein R3315_00905 [Woeseiaceae bacterium]|nr:hypothetical protein [Woeseiaceae bacterium]
MDHPQSASNATKFRLALGVSIALSVAAVVLAYWPGLSGPFLFDDLGSLGDLGRYGGVDDWHTFRQFVFGGETGPTGRPLALLTFLLDGRNWPTDPWPFKRTNLVIHVLNTALVAAFAYQTLRLLDTSQRRAAAVAIVAALCWGLHPFLVSTVLYPVQRMAQLAALFSFAGLNLYAGGRRLLGRKPRRGYLLMSLGAGLCPILAVLSKENGALLPLLIVVFELTVVAAAGSRVVALNKAWAGVFLVLPVTLLAGYFLRIAIRDDLLVQQPMRGFSQYERLLTEMRILFDYLRHLLLPSLYTSGIFQDDVSKSTGLLQPVTTLLSIAGHVALLLLAWVGRRRLPLLSFALLFFYAGHLVESTYFNLELYFEHRNYLPAAFLFLPVAAVVASRVPRRGAAMLAAVVLITLFGFTRYSAGIWSSYETIVEASAQVAPESSRAQQQYSMLLFNRGDVERSLTVAQRALDKHPASQDLNIWEALLQCRTGALSQERFAVVTAAVADQPYDLRNLRLFESFIEELASGRCPDVPLGDMRQLLDRMLVQPVNANPSRPMFAQLMWLRGIVNLRLDDTEAAAADFRASLDSRPGAGRAMMMAALFAAAGHYREAMDFSDSALIHFHADGSLSGEPTGITPADIEAFRSQVRVVAEEAGAEL